MKIKTLRKKENKQATKERITNKGFSLLSR